MTPLAMSRIRSHLAILAEDPHGLAADFFARLFALAPDLRALFPSGPRGQGAWMVAALDHVIRNLDRLDEIATEVAGEVGTTSDYIAIGEALLDTLQARLSTAFDEDARAAWATVFVLLTDSGAAAPRDTFRSGSGARSAG